MDVYVSSPHLIIITRLPIALPVSGPVSLDDVRVPAVSSPLTVPVGGPLIPGLNKVDTNWSIFTLFPDVNVGSSNTFHVFKIQLIVYCLLMSQGHKLKAGYT